MSRANNNQRLEQTELVHFQCQCGRIWIQRVEHYGIIRCKCGAFVWALRPHRDGPLMGYQWLGDKSTLRNYA